MPDTILVVKQSNIPRPTSCPAGSFNDEALSHSECVNCFCFGITNNCKGSKLFKTQVWHDNIGTMSLLLFIHFVLSFLQNTPSLNQLKIINVYVDPATFVTEIQSASAALYQINIYENDAVQVTTVGNDSRRSENVYPYFKVSDNFLGNQIKSYGGYIQYTVRYEGKGNSIRFTPDIVLMVSDFIENLKITPSKYWNCHYRETELNLYTLARKYRNARKRLWPFDYLRTCGKKKMQILQLNWLREKNLWWF